MNLRISSTGCSPHLDFDNLKIQEKVADLINAICKLLVGFKLLQWMVFEKIVQFKLRYISKNSSLPDPRERSVLNVDRGGGLFN